MRIVKICIFVFMAIVLSYSSGVIGQEKPAKEMPAQTTPPEKIKRIAVMDFQNKTGEDEIQHTCKTISQLLLSDLSSVKGVMTLEREHVSDALSELNLGEDGFLNPATAPKAQKAIGADYMVEGSICKKDKDLVFKVRVISLETGKAVFEEEFSGTLNELLKIEKEMSDKIGKLIGNEKVVAAEKKDGNIGHITIAVMPFEDLSPENRTGSLAEMLQYTIESEISQIQQVSVLTREHLNEILEEQKMAISGLMEKKNAIKIGQIVGVKYLLFGSITLVGKELRADVRVMSVESGEIVYTANSTAGLSETEALSKSMTIKILEGLNLNLLKGDRDDIERGAEANTEARYHLDAAIKMKEGNWSVVGRDEVEALQRALYLDALDAGADLFLIDKMIESQMYVEAARKIHKALERKLPKETEGELWHKLAQCYDQKGELAILWHIAKNYPGTRAAIKANWLLGYQYLRNAEIADFSITKKCWKDIIKDTKTLKEIIPERFHSNLERLIEHYGLIENKQPSLGLPKNKTEPQAIVDRVLFLLKRYNRLYEIDVEKLRTEVELFSSENEKGEYKAAFEHYKYFGKYFWEKNNNMFDLAANLAGNLAAIHEFELAREVHKTRIEQFDLFLEKNRFYTVKIEQMIELLNRKEKMWEQVNPENCKLPTYDPDRPRTFYIDMPGRSDWINNPDIHYVYTATDKYPDDYKKAFYYSLQLISADVNKGKFNNMPIPIENLKNYFILVYIGHGKTKLALNFINDFYKGDDLDAKISLVSDKVIIWFVQYYMERMQFKKALELYKIAVSKSSAHFYPMIALMMYKLSDYKGALELLKQRFGQDFNNSVNPYFLPSSTTQKSGRDLLRYERSRYGDPLYFAAKCYDNMGEYVTAYNTYVRFLVKARDLNMGATQNVFIKDLAKNAEERLNQLDEIINKQHPAQVKWNAGDWWEAVQGWHVSSPKGKGLPEGWVFSDMYFEVDRVEKYAGVECYVLNIFENKTREEVLAAQGNDVKKQSVNKSKMLSMSIYFAKTTMMPCFLRAGRACGYSGIRPDGFQFFYLEHNAMTSIIPFAQHKSGQIISSLIFTAPFSSVKPLWLSDCISELNDEVSIQGENIKCNKSEINNTLDIDIMAIINKAYYCEYVKPNLEENPWPRFEYHRYQWWAEGYPWWMRISEKNRGYNEQDSPPDAKYSKLFVLTTVNGKKIKVDTGLPGKLADIDSMRAQYKNFALNYPYAETPSAEMKELFDLILARQVKCYNSLFLYKKNVKSYIHERYMQIDIDDDDAQKFFLEFMEHGPEYLNYVERYLDQSKPEKNNLRTCFIEYGLYREGDVESAIKIVLGHIRRCEERKYSMEEVKRCFQLIGYHHASIIPILLEYYRKTHDAWFLQFAYIIISPRTGVYPSVTKDVDKYYKIVEDWYEKNVKNKDSQQKK